MINKVIGFIRSLDTKEVVYGLLAVAVTTVIASSLGFIRKLRQQYQMMRGIERYRKSLRDQCLSLTVIGRRQGFSLKDVYIPLDLAVSDLAPNIESDTRASRLGKLVIIAGPGAGKSTIVKYRLLSFLEDRRSLPFLIRLREYSPEKNIQQYLADQLRANGIPDPELVVRRSLMNSGSLCVLDGLDEVRPNLIQEVYVRINAFYQEFFAKQPGSIIVTCRKEAYRDMPLDIPIIYEVRPLTDEQITRFADKWPLMYPSGKNAERFISDLFSTPRIHELATSPLLLVGGLMQYTESNLGIPEERVQYLARVAQWLVSDWATAQGHPPDKYRSLYPRVLSRLALHMHMQETSEFPSIKANEIIASWLPDYGFDKREASEVLSGLLTRTGILIKDVPQTVIYSQFGLQEYYASIDLLETIKEEQLVEFANKVWWREPILLAIAQQKEPTANIQTIFTVNSLLAAEAVAESPTPSTAMQIRAVGSCLHSIDNRVPGASAASVRVLRKVKGNLEEYLVKELEKRLTTEGISQEAGLVLALCGTPAATVALSRHPSVWEKCLQYAGYVSSGFEKLLVRWIRDGDEEQSRHATDLLSDRLSSDRFTELMSFLSTLPMEKADYVARMLMKFIARNIEDLSEISLRDISTIAACVSRVQPPFTPNPEKGKYRHDFGEQFVNMAIAIRTAEPQCSESRIRSMLTDSIIWTTHRKTLICWLCASVILLVRTGVTSHVIALAAAIIAVLDISRREKFIGRQWRYFSWGGTQTEIALCLFMIGAAAASVSIQGSISLHGHNGQGPFYLLTIACLLLGIANNHLVYWPTTRLETKIFSIIKVCIWILLCFMIVTCAVTQLWTIDVVNMIRLIGSIYMIVLCVYVYRLRHSFIQTNYYLDAIEKES